MTLKARITAIDRFIKGCREDGIYTDLQAACVMAGWDSLAGALTPLKGAAPTNSGLSSYDRGVGITGDGSSYLDSNYAYPTGLQNDCHVATWVSGLPTAGVLAGYGDIIGSGTLISLAVCRLYNNGGDTFVPSNTTASGLRAASRSDSSSFVYRRNETNETATIASTSVTHLDMAVFARQRHTLTPDNATNATLAFYSFGSATDLALLDARVSTLMADLRAIEEAGFDRDAIGYLRAVEEADGAFLETSVKIAVNNLVSGLKAEGLWDAIGSSCLLCGPRTLAGALVPLKGDAPTAYGFVAGDHYRDTGLQGDGTSYLDSNRNNNSDPQDSQHVSVYASIAAISTPTTYPVYIGANDTASGGATHIGRLNNNGALYLRSRQAGVNYSVTGTGSETGFLGLSRGSASTYVARRSQATVTPTAVGSRTSTTPFDGNVFIFGSTANYISNARLAFYSIGSSIDLAKLDSHITAYVTAIGAAL